MSSAYRSNRKATDEDIIRLNSVGMSLGSIAKELNCHPTTVTLRLKDLNIPPADTRRAFMESIYLSMPRQQQEWLEQQVNSHFSIKEFVQKLLMDKFLESTNGNHK